MSVDITVNTNVRVVDLSVTFDGNTVNLQPTITIGGGGGAVWGGITGTLSDQTDLQNALNAKANVSGQVFTGAISATNLSGTNTGDQDISGIATNASEITTLQNNRLLEVQAGANITVDNTDPLRPIVSSTGGGAGAASQLAQGSPYNVIGELLNDSFPGTTLNTVNWSLSAPAPPDITINNKLIVNSGASDYSEGLRATKFYAYEKLTIEVDFVCVTKNSGDAWGFTQRDYPRLPTFSSKLQSKFDQFTGVFSMGNFSMPAVDFSAGDNLKLILRRTASKTIVTIENLSDATKPIAYGEFPISKWGTSGEPVLAFLGGQQEFNNITITSDVRNYGGTEGVVYLGDSITQGAGASSASKRYVNLIMNNQQHLFENLGFNSWASQEFSAAVVTELLTGINAKYLVVNVGYNDQSRNVPTATLTTNLETIATTAQGLGYEVVFISPFPRLVGSNATYVTAVQTAATNSGSLFVDLTPFLGNIVDRDIIFDGVHPNDLGHELIADSFREICPPKILEDLIIDLNNTDVYLRGIPQSSEDLPLVGIDQKGRAVKLDQSIYRNNRDAVILQTVLDPNNNVYNLQDGNIGIDGKIYNANSYTQINPNGLQIGFNNNVNDTTGSNINITNKGVSGIGFPQLFDNITGLRNIVVNALSIKGNGNVPVSGNDNLIINGKQFGNTTLTGSENVLLMSIFCALTSGSRNIGIGGLALRNLTTGSDNIAIYSRVDVSGSSRDATANNANGTILIGTPYDFTGSELLQNGEVVICAATRSARIYTFGAKGGYNRGSVIWRSGIERGTNVVGADLKIQASRGTGSAKGGDIIFEHSVPNASGTTAHSTFNQLMKINEENVEFLYPAKHKGYTVATLPAGEEGMTCYVTDADSLSWRGVAVGGGTAKALVFFDGTNWIYH